MVEYIEGIETRKYCPNYVAGAVVFPPPPWRGPARHDRWFFTPMAPTTRADDAARVAREAVKEMMKTASPDSKMLIASYPWAGAWTKDGVHAFKLIRRKIGDARPRVDVNITLDNSDKKALPGIRDALPENVETISVFAPKNMKKPVHKAFKKLDNVWFNDDPIVLKNPPPYF